MNTFTPKLFTLLKNGYSKADLRADIIAGLTVAIVALPLAMAFGIASGASPDKGLITAVVAGFLVSLLGGSRVQIAGPTGAFVVVIYNVISYHGYDGLILTTILAGIILIISGYARLGQLIKFIPYPVVTGFTTGLAVIIASSQIKDFLGLDLEKIPVKFIPKWESYFSAIDTVNLVTLIIGLGSLIIIILLRKFAPKLPGYLIAMTLSAIVVALLHLPVETIGDRFPDMPSGLPIPHLPSWTVSKVVEIVPSAFVIAFLISIEALFSAVVADNMTGYNHRPNQELIGLGISNIASACFGGLPATGALARTTTNIKAGGKTPMAGIFHAIFILLFIIFATDIMSYVPMAVLAAILFIVAWGMSEINHFIDIFRLSPSDRNVMLLTFFLTILVDLTVAIAVGVTLSSLLFIGHMTKSVIIRSEGRRITDLFEDKYEEDDKRINLGNDIEVFRLMGPLFFGTAGDLIDKLKSLPQMPKVLILRLRLVPYLDATGATAINNIVKQCQKKGTKVILSGVQLQPETILHNAHIKHGANGVFYSPNYETSLQIAQDMVLKDIL